MCPTFVWRHVTACLWFWTLVGMTRTLHGWLNELVLGRTARMVHDRLTELAPPLRQPTLHWPGSMRSLCCSSCHWTYWDHDQVLLLPSDREGLRVIAYDGVHWVHVHLGSSTGCYASSISPIRGYSTNWSRAVLSWATCVVASSKSDPCALGHLASTTHEYVKP
jgi:hypothetical protein